MNDKNISVLISKNEAWKILDAITAYQKDYALTGPTNKLFDSIISKLKNIVSN